jgi:hypothetical protein
VRAPRKGALFSRVWLSRPLGVFLVRPTAARHDAWMASTPVWVTLLVAALGVAGGVATAILTRRGADKRENQRWQREREAEEARWQREQEERHQQWQREDHARWLAERRTIYANYLQRLDRWREAIAAADAEVRGAGLTVGTVSELESLETEFENAYETLSLLAPTKIVHKAANCMGILGRWHHALAYYTQKYLAEPSAAVNGEGIFEELARLRDLFRQDLGVDAEDE